MIVVCCRDCIGDCSLAGDPRWAGTFGVNLDFVARCHCSVEFISVEDMQVRHFEVTFVVKTHQIFMPFINFRLRVSFVVNPIFVFSQSQSGCETFKLC